MLILMFINCWNNGDEVIAMKRRTADFVRI